MGGLVDRRNGGAQVFGQGAQQAVGFFLQPAGDEPVGRPVRQERQLAGRADPRTTVELFAGIKGVDLLELFVRERQFVWIVCQCDRRRLRIHGIAHPQGNACFRFSEPLLQRLHRINGIR